MRSLLTWAETEVTLGLSVPGASEEEHALAGGGELGELIEGVGRASCSNDSLPGSSGELEGSNPESRGDVEESDVVGDGSDDGDYPGVILGLSLGNRCAVLGEMPGDSGDGDGVSVQSRLVESLVDDLVELGFSPPGEEGVESNQALDVGVR